MITFAQNQEFKWFDCPFTIRRNKNNNVEYISLKPQIQFCDQNNNKEQIFIDIKLEKHLNYDTQLGFTWHKSWIIPQITIVFNLQEINELSNNVVCEMTSAYPTKKNEMYYLNEVRIDGQNQKRFVNNEVKFNNLKFTSTSFNNDGNRFNLVLILYFEEFNSLKILKSQISSGIYIDSRKEARTKKETIVKIQQIINPLKFEEPLMIKKKDDEIMIENDINGFLDYYSATNIRNKIKHPFFVCYKFSNTFTLYYSSKELKKSENIYFTILSLIKQQKKNAILIYTPYQTHELKKRVMTIFDNWRIHFITLVFDKEFIPKNFIELPAEKLIESYREYYLNNIEKSTKKVMKNSKNCKNLDVYSTQIMIQNNLTKKVKTQFIP